MGRRRGPRFPSDALGRGWRPGAAGVGGERGAALQGTEVLLAPLWELPRLTAVLGPVSPRCDKGGKARLQTSHAGHYQAPCRRVQGGTSLGLPLPGSQTDAANLLLQSDSRIRFILGQFCNEDRPAAHACPLPGASKPQPQHRMHGGDKRQGGQAAPRNPIGRQ